MPRPLAIAPVPDFGRIEKVFRRSAVPDRVPFYELFSNIEPEVLRTIGKYDPNAPPAGRERYLWEMKNHFAYQYALGYDYVNVHALGFNFPVRPRPIGHDATGNRQYTPGDFPTIASWEDFEKYPWPKLDEIDYTAFEVARKTIPEGMKAIVMGPGGVLENVMWILGYEGISFLLYDDPALVEAMFAEVGTRMVAFFDAVSQFEVVGAAVMGDDMGFKTQVFLKPEDYRRHVFPWQAKVVEAIHRHGKPAGLHACGNLSAVMGDVIACGWDAKHSFEDVIEPVWETKSAWGDKISLLGGFDMDRICRSTPAEVRAHTRALIDRCAPGGGWALGTGNTVANYVPRENFLAMIEEGWNYGKLRS